MKNKLHIDDALLSCTEIYTHKREKKSLVVGMKKSSGLLSLSPISNRNKTNIMPLHRRKYIHTFAVMGIVIEPMPFFVGSDGQKIQSTQRIMNITCSLIGIELKNFRDPVSSLILFQFIKVVVVADSE